MFTVKACVLKPDGTEIYQLYQAQEVHVRPTYAPDQVVEVELIGEGPHKPVQVLLVGPDVFEHYQGIFVMNEQGKTVQKIQPIEGNKPA